MIKAISLLFYNLFLKLYVLGIKLIRKQNKKAALWLYGRENWREHIKNALGENHTSCIWMHCSSLGEFEQGRPLLGKLRAQHPEKKILLTFFSPSGYEIRKNYPNADHVFYLPMDGKKNANDFLDLVKPELVIFVKYEFWYHYFTAISQRRIPFILISALFRPDQVFFKWYGALYRSMLNTLTHIFVQDTRSQKLLAKIGYTNATIINDTRIDRVYSISQQAQKIPTIELFLQGKKALIGGSVYDIENELIHKAYSKQALLSKIIIVPHEVDEAHLEEILKVWGDDAVRYTRFREQDADKQVMIVDTVGLLSSIYQYGILAIIGGGFGKAGIHNTLEPAAFGLPVIFGPNYDKFVEAKEMLATGGAFAISNYIEFQKVLTILYNEDVFMSAHNASAAYITEHTGGTEAVYDWLVRNNKL
jgi:3-deoxy-D-manno-octulosonic-acid transferase